MPFQAFLWLCLMPRLDVFGSSRLIPYPRALTQRRKEIKRFIALNGSAPHLDWVRLTWTEPDSMSSKIARNYVKRSWKSRTYKRQDQHRKQRQQDPSQGARHNQMPNLLSSFPLFAWCAPFRVWLFLTTCAGPPNSLYRLPSAIGCD
jgi:hypothetical protein